VIDLSFPILLNFRWRAHAQSADATLHSRVAKAEADCGSAVGPPRLRVVRDDGGDIGAAAAAAPAAAGWSRHWRAVTSRMMMMCRCGD
jgi:hypothetical protein